MRPTRFILMAALAGCPAAIHAAEEQRPRIVVSGSASVTTPPDLATIEFRLVGEGTTSDAAVSALVANRRAIDDGVASLGAAAPTASRISINEVRGSGCRKDDDDAPRLSTGACAVIGYIASVEMTTRLADVKRAGTLVGLLGRLHASEPHVDGFALSDPQAAERRAIAGALVDARQRAEAIAAGTGVKLGRLVVATTVNERDGGVQDVIVTAQRRAPALFSVAAPIVVDVTPRPIETRAQVTVTYEIAS